jgi:outer membrane protein assembly factor BamA
LIAFSLFISPPLFAEDPSRQEELARHEEAGRREEVGGPEEAGRHEQLVFNLERLQPFDGRKIREIRVRGLKRTKERAVRWLLSQREGDVFSGATWLKGIHKLYNTTVVYDIFTDIRQVGPGEIDIDLSLSDRWTLMPFGIAQAGGGSNNLGGGIWEANVLGYFGQMGASYSVFNNVASYDFNIYQEFFLDTDFIWGLDISGTGVPVELQRNDGSSLGSFTWNRQQEQFLIGHKFEPKIRLFAYLEYYNDAMVSNSGAPEARVYSSGQYRVRPTLILGRSELTNFLEQGFELTLAPTSANFLSGSKQYSTMVATYKRVFLDQNTNYAMFINAGAMSRAPIPYLFRLGGYDTVRGFTTNRAIGRYYFDHTLEYRPYLTRLFLPLFGEAVIQGALFEDAAFMWDSSDLSQTRRINSEISLFSAGFGIRINLLRFAGCILRLDAAKTLSPSEGWGGSLGVGQFF